jgi:6-phosphogluconolactonase (cycloisomerase 2 family)
MYSQVRAGLRCKCPGVLAGVMLVALLALTPAASGQATGRAVFVANNGNLEGSVTAFDVDADGMLTFVNRVITGSRPSTSVPCPGCNAYEISITPNGRFLATCHPSGPDPNEQVSVFEVVSDASITQVGAFVVPGTPMDVAWVTDELLVVARTDPTPNELRLYRFDPVAHTLTLKDTEAIGSFVGYLAVHPSHQYVYINDSGSTRAIRSYRVESNDTLTLIDTDSTGSYYALELTVTHDGTKLYAAGGITYVVLGYTINADGTLTPLAGSPFPSPAGGSPSNVFPSGDDAFLLVGTGTSAEVHTAAIDEASGAIAYTGYFFDVGMQGTLGDVSAVDDLVFITDNSTLLRSGLMGLYSFSIKADGSLQQNGSIASTQGIAPRGIAVWSPALLAGDLNCDGAINTFDIDPFVLALTDTAAYAEAYPGCDWMLADINGDGFVNTFDIDPFVLLLTGG